MHITIVGLGPGPIQDLTARGAQALEGQAPLLLRTANCPGAQWLTQRGIAFTALDAHDSRLKDLDQLAAAIAQDVIQAARTAGQAVYAVPGAADAQDATVQALCTQCRQQGITLTIIPGLPLCAPAGAQALITGDLAQDQPPAALLSIRAVQAQKHQPNPRQDAIVTNMDSRIAASGVKQSFLRIYPPQHPVLYLYMQKGEYIAQTLALVDIDRQPDTCYDHTASFYCPATQNPYRKDLQALEAIMHRLRAPGGCPWDREQTHESIRLNLIEEAYEVLEAINTRDVDALCEELGDVLLQVVFHAAIAAQRQDFNLLDVIDGICRKLIHRHPHVFGTAQVTGSQQVLDNWAAIKQQEKQQHTFTQTLRDVPQSFPALMRCQKVQQRAARAGMDFESPAQAFDMLVEELGEVRELLSTGGQELAMELGDLLFAAVNVVRHCGQDAQDVLNLSTDKFIRRFAAVEELATQRGLDMPNTPLEELDLLWTDVKKAQNVRAQGKS